MMKRKRGGQEGDRVECHLDERCIYMCTYVRPTRGGRSSSAPAVSVASLGRARPPHPPPGIGPSGGQGALERQKGLQASCLTLETEGDPGPPAFSNQCHTSLALGRLHSRELGESGAPRVGSPAWRGRAWRRTSKAAVQLVCISPN